MFRYAMGTKMYVDRALDFFLQPLILNYAPIRCLTLIALLV